MKLRKKHLSLALALLIGLGGLSACNNQNNDTSLTTSSDESTQMSNESSIEDIVSNESVSSNQEVEKEYDQMTKDEKISYLEDKIFNIRVKARSLEMKLEENPQYSDEEKEKIQNTLDSIDDLIEKINVEIDKLENE
ncbi:MAG: hypothetical protein ACTIH2_08940 [Anaerococcus sp.]